MFFRILTGSFSPFFTVWSNQADRQPSLVNHIALGLEKMVSLTGEIGYEYTAAPHRLISINKTEGTVESELLSEGPEDDSYELQSIKDTLDTAVRLASCDYVRSKPGYVSGHYVAIELEDFEDDNNNYLYYPEEIDIVRIEGELVLHN